MENSNTDLRQKIDDLQSELLQLETDGSSIEDQVEKERIRLEKEWKGQVALLTQKVLDLTEREKNQLEQVEKIGRERKERKKVMEGKFDHLEEEIRQERFVNSKLEEEVERLKKEREEREREKEEKGEVEKRINEMEEALSLKEGDLSQKEGELSQLVVELSQKEEQLSHLEEQLSLHKNALKELSQLQQECVPQKGVEITIDNVVKVWKSESERVSQSEREEREERGVLTRQLREREGKMEKMAQELQDALVKIQVLSVESDRVATEERNVGSSRAQSEGERTSDDVIQGAINQCKEELYAEYESKLHILESSQEEERNKWKATEGEEREKWKREVKERMRQKEEEMRDDINKMTDNWNKEKKELESLAQVAADAFRSGTDSVNLLKEQVMAQRGEMEEIKRSHKKEIMELQSLLEVKRRRARSNAEGRGGSGSLEEASEFEYLKNILYQYMMGKETQTLSKVLCAVLKFSKDQQRHIIEHEDKKLNMLREEKIRRRLELKGNARQS